ncbi:ABC transporter ATP-binding protein [Brevibacillus borstelensis]|uniref:ABC transporter ATP-binding protein n=1 Tax=Brevibacillus borstelensis TaxID=45462 RepID=UPI0030BA4502
MDVTTKERPPGNKSIFRWIISYIKPYRRWVLLSIVTALLVAVTEIWMGLLIQRMVENLSVYGKLLGIASLIFGLTIVGFFSKYLMKYSAARFSSNAIRDLKTGITVHIEKLPISTMEKYHSGDVVSRLTNDAMLIQNFFHQHFYQLFYLPVVFVGALTVLLVINWKLILISIAILPAAIWLMEKISKPLKKNIEELQENLGAANAVAQDTISGIHMVKAFQLHDVLLHKYETAMTNVLRSGIKAEKRRAWMTAPGILLFSSPILVFTAYGGYQLQTGELSLGSLVIFSYLLPFIIQPLSLTPMLFAQVQETTGASKRLFDIYVQSVEQDGNPPFAIDPDAVPVVFDEVTFAYDGKSRILNGVSFTLEKNKTIALVGASGSGKSTIMKLLCGFYQIPPQNGRINVFGHPLQEWNLAEMRNHISLVSQETTLFPVTIAENISYGRLDATREEIITAAKAANAHDFIMDLPNGYETVLGERGSRISGGQKQRIAIARAILKDAPILLLDEPTSALDTQSEALVQEALDYVMRNRTVLVIAHRLSTIKEADEVLVLEQGRIVESGTHDELLAQNGLYTKLYKQQFATEESAELVVEGAS